MTIWTSHVQEGIEYGLTHLNPFQYQIALMDRTAHIHVSFRCHAFTREWLTSDADEWKYRGAAELRAFCPERYQYSLKLPEMLQTLDKRKVEFSQDKNGISHYVTLETEVGTRYAAFFDVRQFRDKGRVVQNALSLDCKSAFVLHPEKPHPGKGRVKIQTVFGKMLRDGSRPHPP